MKKNYYDFTLSIFCPDETVLKLLYKDLIPSKFSSCFEVGKIDRDTVYQTFEFKLKSGDKWFSILDHIITFMKNIHKSKYKNTRILRVAVKYDITLLKFRYGATWDKPFEFGAFREDNSRRLTSYDNTLEKLIRSHGGTFRTLSSPYFFDEELAGGTRGLKSHRDWENVKIKRVRKM